MKGKERTAPDHRDHDSMEGDRWIPYHARTLVMILASVLSFAVAFGAYEIIDHLVPHQQQPVWYLELIPMYLAITVAVTGCVCGVRMMLAGFPRWFKVLSLIFVLLDGAVVVLWLQAVTMQPPPG